MKHGNPGAGKAARKIFCFAFPLSLFFTLLAFVLLPGSASAHAILLRSDPAKDAALSSAPSQVHMWFSEDLNPTFSSAYVVNAANSAATVQSDVKTHVDNGDAHVATSDAKEMDLSLKPNLPPAVYVVLYRTQSADDGHILHGSYIFKVADASGNVPTFKGTLPNTNAFAGGGSSGQLDLPTFFSLVMIILVDLGAIFWLGAQLWHMFVLPAPETDEQEQRSLFQRVIRRFDSRFSIPLLLLILLANVGVLIGLALSLTGGQWGAALAPALLIGLVAHGNFGTYWIAREIVLLLALGLAVLASLIKHPPRLFDAICSWGNFALGLALLSAITLSGHASAARSDVLVYAILSDLLHLLAASLWIGGMLYIALVYLPVLKTYPALQQTRALLYVLPRYSPLALTGVLVMSLSGPFNAAVHMSSWDQFFTTAYGRTLVVKILLVGSLLLTSAVHVLLLRPRLAKDYARYHVDNDTLRQAQETDSQALATPQVKLLETRIGRQTRRLSTILRWEPLLGVMVIVCTGLLAVFAGTLQPAALPAPSSTTSTQQNAPAKPFHTIVETTDKKFQVKVSVDPNRFGENTFSATVMDSSGKPVPDTSVGVSLYATMLDMDMGTEPINLKPDGKGNFSAKGDLSMGGHWGLRVQVRTLDNTLHEATLKFETPF